MVKEIFNYAMIFSVLTGVIFVIATFLSKRGRDKSIIYLNLFVLFFTLNNLQIVLIDNVFTQANFFVRNMLIPFYALILPSFYTFLTYYLSIQKKITSFMLFTGVVFVVEIIIRIVFYNLYYHDNQNYIVARYSQIEEIINALFSLFLFLKSFFIVFNQTKLYQQVLTFDNIKWLKKFLFLGSIILLTWIFAIIFNLDKVLNPKIFIYYPLRLSSSFLLFWLGYQGFFNYSLMSERIQLRRFITKAQPRKSNTFFTTQQKETDFYPVKEHIIENKRYLDPEYSLDVLSKELKISTSKLSRMINEKGDYNFSDYINLLRVEEAKKILIDPEYSHYTIVAIGLECGFNSKSTFYTAFKKFTKTTPTEYKKSI